MPFYHAPIIHDRQSVLSNVEQQTSSSTFSDVVGATVTAKDLGQPGSYLGWISLLISNSNNNSNGIFRLLLNGNPVGNEVVISLKVKDLDVGFNINSSLDGIGIVVGDVLQLQFATGSGTLTLVEFSLLVDGIPASRVVQ